MLCCIKKTFSVRNNDLRYNNENFFSCERKQNCVKHEIKHYQNITTSGCFVLFIGQSREKKSLNGQAKVLSL